MSLSLIDAWMLAIDATTTSSSEVDNYVHRLAELADLVRKPCLSFALSANSAELLEADGLFPVTAMSRAGAKWPRRADIFRLVGGIIDRTCKVEDFGVNALLASGFSAALSRQCTRARADHLSELCVRCLLSEAGVGRGDRILSDGFGEDGDIEVTARLDDIDPPPSTNLPEMVSGTVKTDSSLAFYLDKLDPQILAARGFISEAIALSAMQKGFRSSPWPECENYLWTVGSSFLESLKSMNVLANPARASAMLRACVDTVVQQNMGSTHPLRIGKGANDPQIVRKQDGAKAWRRDIDDELHLHYWSRSSFFEFSVVVPHNTFSIVH